LYELCKANEAVIIIPRVQNEEAVTRADEEKGIHIDHFKKLHNAVSLDTRYDQRDQNKYQHITRVPLGGSLIAKT
jgi:hypothetical protein